MELKKLVEELAVSEWVVVKSETFVIPGKYTVMAVCQIVHYASGLSFLKAVCLIRQRLVLKTLSHSDLGNKPLPISFLGSGLETLAEGDEGALHLGSERPRVYFDLSPKEKERETLAEGEEGSLHLGPERPRVYSDLSPKDKDRGLRDSNYDQLYTYLKQHEAHANENKMMLDRFTQHIVDPLALMSNVSHQQYYSQSYTTSPSTHENGLVLDEEQLLFIAGGQDKVVDEDVDEQPVQDLALNVDNVFQADECDAFDSDVDEAPTAQTMFMANLSSADPVYDEASSSYDSDILSEVHDHDNYQDDVCELHEVHEMHDNVQPNRVINSDAEYTSDSNMISYDQYVKDNAKPVIQNNVSSVQHDASMMIINEMHEQTAQCVSVKAHTKVVDASLTADLRYIGNKLNYLVGTCSKDFSKRDKKQATAPLNRKKQVTSKDQCESLNNNTQKHVEILNIQKTNVPMLPSTRVNSCTDASGSRPRSNTKKNKISPAKCINKKKVEAHLRTNKSSLKTMNRVDSSISSKRTVVHIVIWYLDSGCSKHVIGDRSRLRNFVKKFIGIVRFENDHFGAIMGYKDYVIGDSMISRVYYVEGLGHNLFSVGKDLVRGLPRLKFEKDHLCSSCQLGKSKKHTHKPKAKNTNLEVLNTLHMDLCGPIRVQTINGKKYILVIVDDYSSEDLGKLQPKIDIRIFIGYAPSRLGYRIYNKRTRRIMKTIHIQFDEMYEPMAPVQLVSTPSSTTIDQDAPSLSHSSSSSELQTHISHQGVGDGSTIIEDNPFTHVDNDPFVNVFASKPSSKASSSRDASSAESTHVTQPHNHLRK
nr:integrase, catalytic region, zinc finger, CCHC-type, peptidase aspartic, catalytic [Tanacetum cinerariifolium]